MIAKWRETLSIEDKELKKEYNRECVRKWREKQ